MQLFYKLVITIIILVVIFLVVVRPLILFLHHVWTSQIDPRETIRRVLNRLFPKPQAEIIATRDPNKIYQNGKEVGNVTGQVEIKNDLVIFHMLSETADLEEDHPLEYKKESFQIISTGSRSGIKITGTVSDGGKLTTTQEHDVIEDVTCKKLK